jgi:hypothetical protein
MTSPSDDWVDQVRGALHEILKDPPEEDMVAGVAKTSANCLLCDRISSALGCVTMGAVFFYGVCAHHAQYNEATTAYATVIFRNRLQEVAVEKKLAQIPDEEKH